MKKLFKDSHPDLFNELHPSKNDDINFATIYENSGKNVWWQCIKNKKHFWRQSITARTRLKYGCPYCSGRLTLPEDSFATLFPEIAAELHPFKNGDFDPSKFRSHSNKVMWWKCKNNHEWQERIHNRVKRKSGCKECDKINNSIARSYPEISKEWHPTKNAPFTPEDYTASSKKRVWWQCDSGHEWQVRICTRTFSKYRCPECSKVKAIAFSLPSLAIHSPDLAKQWHPTKNNDLDPSCITAGSSKKVWWLCPANPSHEWEASINNRRKGRGCPYCAKTILNPQDSLLKRFPKIAKQWHPTKNGQCGPSDISYGSQRRVWWQCTENPQHEWQSTVAARTQKGRSNKADCPTCSKSRFAETNSLLAVHPEIAAEWHPTKNNDLTPGQVTRASGQKVWWKCLVNPDHEWNAQIKNRTVLRAGCPHCSTEKNIIRVTEHMLDLLHTEIDYYHIFLGNLRTITIFVNSSIENTKLIQPYYRMLYTSTITALETYLSDAFIKQILKNEKRIEKFIETNPEFNKKQYSLTEIIDWHKNTEKRVTEYLYNNIIWHNIPKIQNMYREVLGIIFLDDISNILKAVSIRHDLVHRNGRNKSGSFHKFNKPDILQLISDCRKFVDHIDQQIVNLGKDRTKG
jgi:hypothetical protein